MFVGCYIRLTLSGYYGILYSIVARRITKCIAKVLARRLCKDSFDSSCKDVKLKKSEEHRKICLLSQRAKTLLRVLN